MASCAGGAGKIQLVLNDPPDGITLRNVVLADAGAVLELLADAEKVRPGFRGNLIVEAYPEGVKNPGGGGKGSEQALGTLPAIPIEILRPNR